MTKMSIYVHVQKNILVVLSYLMFMIEDKEGRDKKNDNTFNVLIVTYIIIII